MEFHPISEDLDVIGRKIVDSAFRVHNAMGPGLLESVYEECMIHDLKSKGLRVASQLDVPIDYFGNSLKSKLRLDMLVEGEIIIELKSVERMIPLYESQMLTYLKLSRKRLGYLINFNVQLIKDGIKRMAL